MLWATGLSGSWRGLKTRARGVSAGGFVVGQVGQVVACVVGASGRCSGCWSPFHKACRTRVGAGGDGAGETQGRISRHRR